MKLPESLIKSMKGVNGFDELQFLNAHEQTALPTSVRINPAKAADIQFLDFGENIKGRVPWSKTGYYLKSRPSFTTDPMFHGGAYYVQEASSMFLEEAVNQVVVINSSIRVLDLCAAPGGKSTHLLSLMNGKGLLVSNEIIKSRAAILTENIIKWGAVNYIVTNNEPWDFRRLIGFFDLMVVDAPCSGSGLFRKEHEAIGEWSSANVAKCFMRQKKILADALPALAQGGKLIYSTCSYSKEENEDICDWLMEEWNLKNIPLQLQNEWNIVETVSSKGAIGYRFYPDKVEGEGFFLAVFGQAHSTNERDRFFTRPVKNEALTKNEIAIAQKYFPRFDEYNLLKTTKAILAFPAPHWKNLLEVQSKLFIKKAGITIGQIVGNEFIPAHALAMFPEGGYNFESIDIDLETALKYLRYQPFSLDSEGTGWRLLTYRDSPLGFVKKLSNRINNYYPKEWRILNK